MSLLCVTVRRARLIGTDTQFSSYVTLKLQNVKSTTVTVKGCNPNWEQDFMFETNRMDTGLVIELWNKGLLWDKLIGNHWMPLMGIQFATEVGEGQWLSLDAELELINGEVCGTHTPTGHMLLLETHFEPPYEFQIDDVGEFSRKLELLNTYMEQEMVAWNHEQRSRFNHPNQLYSGLSEDSDYTSDVSYPIQQNPSFTSHHPNSSTSHFGGASNLSRRAFDTIDKSYNQSISDPISREESIEYPNESNFDCSQQQNYFIDPRNQFKSAFNEEYTEPLSYNSRPPRRVLPQINNKSVHNFNPNLMNSNNYIQSIQNYPNNQMTENVDNCQYYNDFQTTNEDQQMIPDSQSCRLARRRQAIRKPSLERQGGFEHFDENYGVDSQKQAKYESRYDKSADISEQYYSIDDSFRQNSYESYTNSLGPDIQLENDVSLGTDFNQMNSTQDLQRNNNEISAQPFNWNNESIGNHSDQTIWTRKNSDKKKEQWKSSVQKESSLWQTVSEDFDDTTQNINNLKDDKQSPQFFTPKSSIDQSVDHMIDRRDSLGRQSTEETVPADDVHNRMNEFVTLPPQLPPTLPLTSTSGLPHSAIKSDNKPSGEPKTVKFSDDIPEKSPPKTDIMMGPSIISSSLTTSLSSSANPDGLSKARIRWLTAFNKITSEFSEVCLYFIINSF